MSIKNRSILILLVVLPLIVPLIAAGEMSVKIIVNASNPASMMKKAQISNFFLKKAGTWENGHKVLPVDQVESSSVRKAFSEQVHGKDVHQIVSYWQKQIFSGREVPPVEKDSDREVLAYVRDNTDAIGYVSDGAAVGEGIKVVKVLD
ncbi:MAG: phosphate ABC transporter substrate-binding protein [Nitrospirae bacterium]|nr:phosphate ABC transporter substrate-binding protein [Candidatus Manganitrophaceae bacterium]